MTVTSPENLTAETVPAYLAEHADKIKGIFPEGATLTASAILGGNVNYAFCISAAGSSKQVFVKQAPEFVAIFGPDGFPLTSERMQQEIDAYAEWNTLLGEALSAKYLPKIYFFDKSRMVVCMEFFNGFDLLDHVLTDNAGDYHSDVAKGLGEFMGKTHAMTHSSQLSDDRKAYLVKHFENRAMRDVQLEFVFTKCYKEATNEQRAGLTTNDAFYNEIALLKQQYNGETDSLVLSHGDLHPGSVMVDKNGGVKVIDPEFTVYGPPGLDVGSLLSGYCLGAIHQAFLEDQPAVERIVEGAQNIWDSYVNAMKENGITDEALLKEIEIETVGFTVAEVCRTAMEFAGGRKWLQFEDEKKKADAKKAALQLVDRCMIARHTGGMELLLKETKVAAMS